MASLDPTLIKSEYQAARQFNTVVVGATNSEEKELYQARLLNTISYGTKLDFSSKGLFGVADWLKWAAMAAGYVPGIDFPKFYCFTGSSPINLSLETLLKVKTSIDEDYVKPIANLVGLALPVRGKSLNGLIAEAANTSSDDPNAVMQYIKSALGLLCAGAEVVRDFVDRFTENTLSHILNNSFVLKRPKQLSLDTTKNGVYVYLSQVGRERKSFAFKMGPYLINGVTISYGPFIMSGGYPQYIKVNISLESSKTYATAEDFTSPFKGFNPVIPQATGDLR